jgi:hypothetical protein
MVLRKIQLLRDVTQDYIDNTQSVRNPDQQDYSIIIQNTIKQLELNRMEKLNHQLFFLEKLQEKIRSLPLIYFIHKKNRNSIQEIYEMLKHFDTSGLCENIALQDFLKKNNFLDFMSIENEMQTPFSSKSCLLDSLK